MHFQYPWVFDQNFIQYFIFFFGYENKFQFIFMIYSTQQKLYLRFKI